jgi:hypothetical protein
MTQSLTGKIAPLTVGIKPGRASRGFTSGTLSLQRMVPGHGTKMYRGQASTPILRRVSKVWGHAAVEGRLKPGALAGIVTRTIGGALAAAVKSGSGADVLEVLARSAAKSVMQYFETELRRATVAAYQEGFRAGVAEGIARERAAQAAAAEALRTGKATTTIFPRIRHAQAKADYQQAQVLAQQLQAQYGSKIAQLGPEEDTENIPMRGVTSISGWVQGAGLHEGKLAIQFRGSPKTGGPVVCVYPGAGRAAMEDLLAASSAGKWVWRNVYHAGYYFG